VPVGVHVAVACGVSMRVGDSVEVSAGTLDGVAVTVGVCVAVGESFYGEELPCHTQPDLRDDGMDMETGLADG